MPLVGQAQNVSSCDDLTEFKLNQPLSFFESSQDLFKSIWPKKKVPTTHAQIWDTLCKNKLHSFACGPKESVSLVKYLIDTYVIIPSGEDEYWTYVMDHRSNNTYTLLSKTPLIHLHHHSEEYGTQVGLGDPEEVDVALNPQTGKLVWEFKCGLSGSATEGIDYQSSQVKKKGEFFEYTHCLIKSTPLTFTLKHLEKCSRPLSKAERYKTFLRKGRAYMKKEEYLLGINKLEEANQIKPNQSALLGEISFFGLKAGKFMLARKRARECVKATKKKKIKGACLYNQGRAEEYLELFNEAKQSYVQSLKFRKNKTVQKRYDALVNSSIPPKRCKTHSCLRASTLDQMCVSLYIKRARWTTDLVPADFCSNRKIIKVNQGSWKEYAVLVIQFKDETEAFVIHKVNQEWINPTLISSADRRATSWTQEEIEKLKVFKKP